jgi:predicted transcriptional regulator
VEGIPALVDDVWTRTWNEVAASAEEKTSRQREAADIATRSSVKMDNFVSTFIAMTPAEVTAYIEANVTNLASAKSVINKLALMVLLLARREYRD